MKFLVIICCLFLFACIRKDNKKTVVPIKAPIPHEEIDSFGLVTVDTSRFVALRCGLYINSRGTLGFLAIDKSDLVKPGDKPVAIYLTSVYNTGPSDTINDGIKEMRRVVDTATFKMLNDLYFKDTNHIYIFHPMMDGGSIAIIQEADMQTFNILESVFFAKDKRYCYYNGHIITGAKVSSFKILDTLFSWHIAYDKYNFYSGEDRMNAEDIKDQKLDSIRRKKDKI